MKVCYNKKKIKIAEDNLAKKELDMDSALEYLILLMKNKADSKEIDLAISKRNSISIDISMIREQIYNLSANKKQYGDEILQDSIRNYTFL